MIGWLERLDRLAWFNRTSAVYLLIVVPLYWNFEAYDTTLWEKFLVAHLIVIRMAAGWLGTAWLDRENHGRFLLDIPILLYLGVVALSWSSAINPLKSGMEVVRILLAATIYFSVSRTYRPDFRDVWLGAASVALAVVSIVGILQYLGLGFLDWRSAGLPSSTFFYRNYAAMFVAVTLPLSVAGSLLARVDYGRVLHGIAWTLGGIFLIYTRTRGAWLGALIGIASAAGVLWLARPVSDGWGSWAAAIRERGRLVWVCGLVVICASLIPPSGKGELETLPLQKASAAEAFTSIIAGQGSGRAEAWLQSLGMIAENPLTGVGIGNWDAEYLRFAGPILYQDGGLFARPHNDYLWVVSELGLIGLVVFLAILAVCLHLVWERLVSADRAEDRILITALGVSVIAISVHAFFSFPRERMTATVLPYLVLGWIGALSAGVAVRETPRLFRVGRPLLLVLLSVVTLVPTIQVTRAHRAYFWADAYRTFDRYEEALAAIDAAIDRGVIEYRFYELKALIHHRLGDTEAALEASRTLLDYHPYNPWNFHKIGLFQLELGDFEAARDAFRQGLEYGPTLGLLHRDLGQAFEGLGEQDSARAAYEKALRYVPSDALLRTKLAAMLAAEGDYEAAREHIESAADRLKLTLADADVNVVGDVAMMARAYDAAIRAYGRAAALKPENPTYLANLAAALEASGNSERAVDVLRQLQSLVDEPSAARVQERIDAITGQADGG